jgi:long-chain-fatty-acid--[acyl-carrier-protein] ligase
MDLNKILNIFLTLLLRLRYRIHFKGLERIQADDHPVLFLPNHQALIDPVIIMNGLYNRFTPRPLADENQVSHPLLRPLVRMLRTVVIPDLAVSGHQAKDKVTAGIDEIVTGLKNGDAILFYPSGRLCRSNKEVIGGNSGVASIVHAVPDVRIVLLRTRGLWGSSFSRAQGTPSLYRNIQVRFWNLLINGILFMPRRKVHVELVEPDDFPRSAAKQEINQYLEEWYNRHPDKNTEIPYFWWQGSRPRVHHEPAAPAVNRDTSEIPAATRELVLAKLQELSGIPGLQEGDSLAADLGMDSLVLVEFGSWLQQEFAVSADNLQALQTVADCILAAGGIMPLVETAPLQPVSGQWFETVADKILDIPAGATIPEIFLNQARRNPDKIILSDQISGDKTWRQLILALYALLPEISKIEGKRVGVMLPGSVSAVISWLAVMFSGKEPVMVNWTSGSSNMHYSLDSIGVEQVITARALAGRLEGQGIVLQDVGVSWVYLEELAAAVSPWRKIYALVKSRLSWHDLDRADIADTAAILFTSGSEARPKSVPLTHANFLANGRDFARVLSLSANDHLLGILPVFHSLGLAGTVVLPLCTGLRTVYWPNPTEGAQLAGMIAAYKATVLITTPTFLNGILRSGNAEQLASMRLVFSGAEKCPEHVFATLKKICPEAILCEGYGVTECSPVVTVNSIDNPRPGTIGQIMPSMEYVLVDPETRKETAAGETGQLLVRGPNVFPGYLGDAPSPFVEYAGKSWYDTGDLMFVQDGVLVFAGRLKRFVKLGGEMISLPAIEQVLEAYYPVGDEPVLAVAATADEEHPELVLLTTLATDRQEANQAIRDAGLSPLHNMRLVQRVEQIPLLGTGKIDYTTINKLVNDK